MRSRALISLTLLLLLAPTASAIDSETYDRVGALALWTIDEGFDVYDRAFVAADAFVAPVIHATNTQYLRIWAFAAPEGSRVTEVVSCSTEYGFPPGSGVATCMTGRALAPPGPAIGPLVDVVVLGPGEIQAALAASATGGPPAALGFASGLPPMISDDASHVQAELFAILS